MFSKGSLVELKSGGPDMTVTHVAGEAFGTGLVIASGFVACLWYCDEHEEYECDIFAEYMLKAAECCDQ